MLIIFDNKSIFFLKNTLESNLLLGFSFYPFFLVLSKTIRIVHVGKSGGIVSLNTPWNIHFPNKTRVIPNTIDRVVIIETSYIIHFHSFLEEALKKVINSYLSPLKNYPYIPSYFSF